MNADKNLVFNPRSSVFISGHDSFAGRGSMVAFGMVYAAVER
jgi:hypothetical protein